MSTQNQATRTEKDTMGNVEVPADAYWGAQTQRSRENFKIGGETLPRPMIEAMALVKKAAAITNASLERIEGDKRDLIVQATDEVIKQFYVRSDPYMEVFAIDKEKYEEDRNNIINLIRKLEKG